ncbi:beta-1 adrenergic receptor-like [Glandiceps talaboti]
MNVIIIVVICLDKNLHIVTNGFIISMAVADLLVGAVNVPMYFVEQNRGPFGRLFECILTRSVTVFFILASVAHLLLIAIDRYVAVTFPFRYRTLITKRRAASCVLACWLLSTMAGFAPLLGWRKSGIDLGQPLASSCGYVDYMTFAYVMFMCIVWYAVPVSIMMVLYCLIFGTARKQVKKIRETHRNLDNGRNSPGTRKKQGTLLSSARNMVDQTKAAKVLCIIMGCFLLCTLPGIVCLIYDQVNENEVSDTVGNLTNLVAFMNSALNPLIYGLGNRQLKSAIRKRLCRRTRHVSSAQVHYPPGRNIHQISHAILFDQKRLAGVEI